MAASSPNRASILIVDDERTLARSIKIFLADQGYETEVAENADKALELLDKVHPEIVFLDVSLPGMNGIELLKKLKEYDPSLAVIMMTAYGSIEGAVEAIKLGAFDYLKKPVDLEELRLLAERARETSRLRQELIYYRDRAAKDTPFGEIVGQSPVMRDVLDRVRQIAELEETPPVLITGETGTGKGLIARTLHAYSRRSTRPFIEVNCTAIPATLMEAELFGHERGAFTDARESRMGLFEAADGGFLFLDEVGDIELALQGKLLRAIEDRTVRRIGGIRDRLVDVRILAATHRNLLREIDADRFRKDLYFRLAVILLHLPPLRERGQDILLLANHFLRKFSSKYGKEIEGIDGRAAQLLSDYPWPGNIRELSHVIERAVLWSADGELRLEQLSLAAMPVTRRSTAQPVHEAAGVGNSRPAGAEPRTAPDWAAVESETAAQRSADPSSVDRVAPSSLPPEGVGLEDVERSMIVQALREAGGNQSRAARRLGLTRDTLRYRLKKFGLTERPK
jgi:two-component system response regulator AtoC